MITSDQARDLARAAGIDETSVFREFAQIVFLRSLFAENGAPGFFFKGGTALRLLLGSPRYSEDLDFTVTVESPKDDVSRAVEAAAREIPGLALRWEKPFPTGRTARLRFLPPDSKVELSIRVEMNVREKPVTRKVSVVATILPVSPYPLVTHLDWPEIMAEKVRAALTRKKGRDLYDLWYLGTKNVRVDWPMVKKKMSVYGRAAGPDDLRRKIQDFDDKGLRQDLAPFLPRVQRPLIGQLKSLVQALLE